MRKLFVVATAVAFAAAPHASMSQQTDNVDPVTVSPDHYKVVLENDDVRVVEYSLAPGERDNWHTHPPKVSYVVSGGSLRITLADSTSFVTEDKTGGAVWMNAVPRHYAHNIGTTPVRIVLVEVKRLESQPVSKSEDPALVNPGSITVKLETDSVRVMEAVLPPGFREKLHSHPGYVMYVLSGGKVRLHTRNGEARDSEFKAGAAFYSDPVTHWAENTGTTSIKVMLVELRRR